VDTCAAGLQCSAPTEDHRCSSTVEDVTNWCCVPPDSTVSCTPGGCDCCGPYECSADDIDPQKGKCVPV
jgi:hypothetical protein